jgi:hypothetical protein
MAPKAWKERVHEVGAGAEADLSAAEEATTCTGGRATALGGALAMRGGL